MDPIAVMQFVGGWLAGLGGSALVTRVYLRWHWHEIQRAHTRLDKLEDRRHGAST